MEIDNTLTTDLAALVEELRAQVQVEAVPSEFRGDKRIVVPHQRAHLALEFLKNQKGFDLLVDITAVDYLEYPDAVDRYAVIYVLANTATVDRLIVKTFLNPPQLELPTATDLWLGADWMEREVFDMFGVTFAGHPDLRRILMPDEFTAYPLRKDYPVKGYGERHNFPVITRAES
jgi:NADH-quinone oxidoreductase subunit C